MVFVFFWLKFVLLNINFLVFLDCDIQFVYVVVGKVRIEECSGDIKGLSYSVYSQ